MKTISVSKLADVMRRIYEYYDMSSSYSFYPYKPHMDIETVAHEIAHWIAFAGNARIPNQLDGVVGQRLGDLDDDEANKQEALACAIELLGLCKLGMRVDLGRLADNASTMMQGEFEKNDYRRRARTRKMVRAALRTRRARQGAVRFVAIVQRFQRKART